MRTFTKVKPKWWVEEGPHSSIVAFTVGTLCRNIAGFFFSFRMSEEEKLTLERNVRDAVSQISDFSLEEYIEFSGLSPKEVLFLSERYLVPYELLCGTGHRGAYISADQRYSIAVNDGEHIVMRAIYGGLQVEKVWDTLSWMDDCLANYLDYMTDSRLGYLTSDLSLVGTGLKIFSVLHLPGLARVGNLPLWQEKMNSFGFYLKGIRAGAPPSRAISISKHIIDQGFHSSVGEPVTTGVIETAGSLFVVGNSYTLGVSEPEIVFSLAHIVNEIVKAEREAREQLIGSSKITIEDMVGRAEGVAKGAKFIEFGEGVELWSALQMGLGYDLLSLTAKKTLWELFFEIQGGHIIAEIGSAFNGANTMKISLHRANKFRNIFCS